MAIIKPHNWDSTLGWEFHRKKNDSVNMNKWTLEWMSFYVLKMSKQKTLFCMKTITDFHYLRGLEYDVVENYKYKIGKIWSDFSIHKFPAGLIENEFFKKSKGPPDYLLMSDRSYLGFKISFT